MKQKKKIILIAKVLKERKLEDEREIKQKKKKNWCFLDVFEKDCLRESAVKLNHSSSFKIINHQIHIR